VHVRSLRQVSDRLPDDVTTTETRLIAAANEERPLPQKPQCLCSRSEVLSKPCPVPTVSGIYALTNRYRGNGETPP
jgi:hypothetical protein